MDIAENPVNPWHEVVRRLLKHFDDNEGTTYLYDDDERERFIAETEPALREQVKVVIDGYHIQSK